ncbi:unnamed protein product [Echinostoma caproni]|uniref:Methylmalonic aciduria and homocystinuria type D protein n=1 Tax=Echinostoma caproni TaxID=27848 RepID=A0A183B757_9TREM|nr:unnamed protein product [Echinostoma caproni]
MNGLSGLELEDMYQFISSSGTRSPEKWPNQALGPIDAVNPKYPLPGAVGIRLLAKEIKKQPKEYAPAIHSLPPLREENYASVLVDTHNATELSDPNATLIPRKSENLECSIHALPTLIKQDLASIFPSRKFDAAPLTAIVLSHRTTEGLDQWSDMAISERESLAESFTQSAIDICASLKELGYWADFVNPFSGLPYLGPHGEDALVETDERMKYFGFELDDAFCCKVLRHPRWKHYVFAGLIFTDAPRDHPVLSHF